MKSAEPIQPGPLDVGSRLKEVHDGPLGRDITTTVAITAFEQDRRFDLRILDGPFRIGAHHTLTETEGGGTRIDYVAEGPISGPLRLAEPLLKRKFERNFRRYYDQLKRNLEARGAAASVSAG